MLSARHLRLTTHELAAWWSAFALGAFGFEGVTNQQWSQAAWLSGVIGGAFLLVGLYGRRRV